MKQLLAVLLVCAVAVDAGAQPPPVPRLRDRTLDKASYVNLAKQWKAYIEKEGESADALVNLGMAYNYSEELEAATTAGQRAVEVEPNNPKALWFLGYMLSTYKGDDDAALKLLSHGRDVAPEYEPGLIMLATVHLRRGEISDADETFKRLFDQRVISRPLQDYAYNSLVGLPEGAVIVSGGDNDTFPLLALQAGMGFRRDVIVLNRSLLNLPVYADSQFKRHARIRPNYDIKAHEVKMVDGSPTLLSDALIEKMIEENKAPVYFTGAVSGTVDFKYKHKANRLEGMNWGTSKNGLSSEESAQLFFESYRLDSATDWTVPWALVPNEGVLMGNYATAMVQLSETKGLPRELRARLLDKAMTIAEFHDLGRLVATIQTLQKR